MAKYFVGCKLPNGLMMELISLQLDPITKAPLNVLHPAPVSKQRVALNGSNSVNTRVLRAAFMPTYGKTLVEEELCIEWFKRNATLDCVQTGAVFWAKNEQEFNAKAAAGGKEPTKLEPLNPNSSTTDENGVLVESDPDQLKKLVTNNPNSARAFGA